MARPIGRDVVLAEVEQLTPARALDMGCGSGELALALVERGWRVTALDRNPDALVRARGLFASRNREVELIEADIATFTTDRPYELVINSYALPPASTRGGALAAAARAVAPGGTVIVADWDRSMAERMPMLRPEDLVTLDELAGAFDVFDVQRAEVITTPGEGDEQDGATVLFVALRSRG